MHGLPAFFQVPRNSWVQTPLKHLDISICMLTASHCIMQPCLVREVYDRAVPGWQGRCTAPLLVDKIERRIVSNESKDIVCFLDGQFRLPGLNQITFRPRELSADIDALCEQVSNYQTRKGLSSKKCKVRNVHLVL
jgi:glutathionyl-hydroquinone reductase